MTPRHFPSWLLVFTLLAGVCDSLSADAEAVDWEALLAEARALAASDPGAALQLLEPQLGAVEALRQVDADLDTLARLHQTRSQALRDLANYDLAILEAERFRVLADEIGDPAQQASARFVFGTIEAEKGRYGLALEHFHHARELLAGTRLYANQAFVYNALGVTHQLAEDLPRARHYGERAVELARQAGDDQQLATFTGNLATLIGSLEGPEAALPLQREVQELGVRLGSEHVQTVAQANICRLLIDSGALIEADSVCTAVAPRIAGSAPIRLQTGFFMTLGDLYADLDRPDAALEAYGTALDLARDAVPTVHAETLKKLAEFHEQRGELAEAVRRLRELTELRDENLERERQALVEELEVRYGVQRSAAELDVLRLDAELKAAQIRFRNALLISLAFVLLISLVAIVAMIRSNRLRTILQNNLASRNSELENALQRISELARTDPLTGLLNRRALKEMADYEMARMAREKRPMAVVLSDIDDFKPINDTHGHSVGDEVLAELAERLRSSFRQVDLITRWGGEEFLCLLPNTTLEQAAEAVERMRSNLERNAIPTRAGDLKVTLSWGISQVNDSLPAAIRHADQAMYAAKARGGNAFVIRQQGRQTEGEGHGAASQAGFPDHS